MSRYSKLLLCLLALSPLAACNRRDATVSTAARKPGYQKPATPPHAANFDYYLLQMKWTPASCHDGEKNGPECSVKNGLVMAAFSPQPNSGAAPTYCPGMHVASKMLLPYKDLHPDPEALWEQWQRYGTCTGLAPHTYFEYASRAKAKVSFPDLITTLHKPLRLQTHRIRSRIHVAGANGPGVVTLTCQDEKLTAINVCFTKELEPTQCGAAIPDCKAPVVLVEPVRN